MTTGLEIVDAVGLPAVTGPQFDALVAHPGELPVEVRRALVRAAAQTSDGRSVFESCAAVLGRTDLDLADLADLTVVTQAVLCDDDAVGAVLDHPACGDTVVLMVAAAARYANCDRLWDRLERHSPLGRALRILSCQFSELDGCVEGAAVAVADAGPEAVAAAERLLGQMPLGDLVAAALAIAGHPQEASV